MKTTKAWYFSKTIWASLVTIGTAAAGLGGLPVAGIDNAALSDSILQSITAISGLIAVLGRMSAKDAIG